MKVTDRVRLHDRIFEVYIPDTRIAEEIDRLAREIRNYYQDEEVVFLSVLNGAFIFTADLVRKVELPAFTSFVRVFSYEGVSSSGQIREVMGITDPIEGKNVVILEDIVDTGLTIRYIYDRVMGYNPKSVKVATLLFKKDAYKGSIPVDFIGFTIPNSFVVGYGLDYDGLGRTLPHIYNIVNEE